MADLLEEQLDVLVVGNIERELAIVVGECLIVVVQHAHDHMLNGIPLLVLYGALYDCLLPMRNMDKQTEEHEKGENFSCQFEKGMLLRLILRMKILIIV